MSDRHSKWVRVEPGTVIPAGQPYRIEQDDPSHLAGEYVSTIDREAEGTESIFTKSGVWFVDSSWKPPLDLPTQACVIRANVTSWQHPRILFGHPNPGEEQGMTFCRAIDGLRYDRDEILSFEVLWVDDEDGHDE